MACIYVFKYLFVQLLDEVRSGRQSQEEHRFQGFQSFHVLRSCCEELNHYWNHDAQPPYIFQCSQVVTLSPMWKPTIESI